MAPPSQAARARKLAKATAQHKSKRPPAVCTACPIDLLPDELLLKVFGQLAVVGPILNRQEEELESQLAGCPFRTADHPGDPHPGLRSYPFLAQVCRRWQRVLTAPTARDFLWREVVVDFGHELVTAVHTPIAWADKRPSDTEFRELFAGTKLSASRVLDFVRQRQSSIQRIVLVNSEGYWSDEGDFVSLNTKHNFTFGQFGMMLGMLQHLRELRIQHCNDIFTAHSDTFGLLAGMRRLRVLALEEVKFRLDRSSLADIGKLTELEEVTLTAGEQGLLGHWAIGIDCIPPEWAKLRRLTSLELRGHAQLQVLPAFLAELPLRKLDVSLCRNLSLGTVPRLTSLQTLALQGLTMAEVPWRASLRQMPGVPPLPQAVTPRCSLPDLAPLKALTALNVSENAFTRVPAVLARLPHLQYLDLSENPELQAPEPLTVLSGLRQLRVLDLRGMHAEANLAYWSDAKCGSMRHVTALAKALKRRRHCRVLVDTN